MSVMLHTATGAAAVNETISPGCAFQIDQFKIHLSAAGAAGNLTITIDDGDGAAYDTVVLTQDMTAVTDLTWIPDRPILCRNLAATASAIVIAWANASTRTYGLKLHWSPI